jgi:hypothetical protein
MFGNIAASSALGWSRLGRRRRLSQDGLVRAEVRPPDSPPVAQLVTPLN